MCPSKIRIACADRDVDDALSFVFRDLQHHFL